MAIHDLYSKRLALAERAGEPEVYCYDALPDKFCVQAIYIWRRAIPGIVLQDGTKYSEFWRPAVDAIAEEHGVFQIGGDDQEPQASLESYFRTRKNVDYALDVLEYIFREIYGGIADYMEGRVEQDAASAINELNSRFLEHSIGYRFINGQIIRIDSEFIHAEAVKPAFTLLTEPIFRGAEDEFLKAHRLYREGDLKGAVTEANKAFESVMKVICDQRGRNYPKDKATAATLVDTLIKGGLIPPYLDSAVGSLRTLLTSLVPTIRNKEGGHGQGSEVKEAPQHLAAYALHVTASTIVMLVEAHRANR